MVKAKAPNAPMGAAFMTMATSLKTATLSVSNRSSTGWARSPISARETPNRMETNST